MSIVASRDREAARRLDIFRRFLTHISECILPDIGFVLWDGSTVPADSRRMHWLIIVDEDAVAAMIRRLSVDTFLNLWLRQVRPPQRIFFDLTACRPRLAPGH